MASKRLFIVAKDASKPTVSLLKFEPSSQIFLQHKPKVAHVVSATMNLLFFFGVKIRERIKT